MEAAVALKVPCSTLLPVGVATACLHAIGVVVTRVVVVVVDAAAVETVVDTFIAIDEAGEEVDEDDDEDFTESVRAVEISDCSCCSNW